MKKIILMVLVLISACGCMKIQFGQGSKMEINAEGGSSVNIGNKDIPVNATVTPRM